MVLLSFVNRVLFVALFVNYCPISDSDSVYYNVQCLFDIKCYPYPCKEWRTCQVAHRACSRLEMASFSVGMCQCQSDYCSYVTGLTPICCREQVHDICTMQEWLSGPCLLGHTCESGYSSRLGVDGKCVCCKKGWHKACAEPWTWHDGLQQCPNGYFLETINGLTKCYKNVAISEKSCSSEEWDLEHCSDTLCSTGYTCRRNHLDQPVCCQTTESVVQGEPDRICPHSGLEAAHSCTKDQDCGDCRLTCQNSLCCFRIDRFVNNSVAVPTGFCSAEGSCTGSGNVCLDQLCYPPGIQGSWKEAVCPNGLKSQIFCPGNCCPSGTKCINKVCCDE